MEAACWKFFLIGKTQGQLFACLQQRHKVGDHSGRWELGPDGIDGCDSLVSHHRLFNAG